MADDIKKTGELVKAKTSSLQKRDSNIVSRGLADLASLDAEEAKRIKFNETGVSCCIDHFGVDAPEVFSEGTTIYINRDHPIYKRESAKVDTHRLNIIRLITQEISSFNIKIKERILQANEWWEKGNRYYSNEDYDKAIDAYASAITLNPNLDGAYYNRGNCYAKKGQYNRAIEDYNRLITSNPNDAYAYHDRGRTYADKGQYDRAIEDYNRLITSNPNDAYAYHDRGLVYYEKGQYDNAIEDFNKAIALKPNDACAYNNRGLAYHEKGQYDRAIEDYNRAIALDPNNAAAFTCNRGVVYERLGNKSMAISDYRKACDLGVELGCKNLQRVLKER